MKLFVNGYLKRVLIFDRIKVVKIEGGHKI